MKPTLTRIRRRNIRPAIKPLDIMDGWNRPTTEDVEPADYPWENGKI